MPPEATNAFEIFSSREAGHENHLTRALLVLLRHSPLAHEAWLRAIGLADLALTEIGPTQFRFQTGSLEVPGLEPEMPLRGISVFISREPAENLGPIADSADQSMIPDALIAYLGPEIPIVVVVESKVHAFADASQARNINLKGLEPKWDPVEPVPLRWSRLIDELWAPIELGVADGTEATLLLDFFDFVDAHYRSVGPYSRLRRCGGVDERIRRRCRTILAAATEAEAFGPGRGNGPYVEMEGPASLPRRVAFDLDRRAGSLRLSFWPADTPSQAKAFYSDPQLVGRVAALGATDGWDVAANMHFGHTRTGYAWSPIPSDSTAQDFLDFWIAHLELIKTFYEPPRQPNWDDLLEELEGAGIIASRETFDRHFVETGRTFADVRPGVELSRRWDLGEATEADDRGELVAEVRAAFNLVLETFNASQ